MGNESHSSTRCGPPIFLNNTIENLWNGVCHAAGPTYASQGIKTLISLLYALIRVGDHRVTHKKCVRRVCWWHWKLGRRSVKGKMTRTQHYSPSSDPHTRGMISNMAEQDASSKQSWRASRHLRMATAVFTLGPKKRKNIMFRKVSKNGQITHHKNI
jgi:hypothetical protein